jgi:cytochrome o ubiquinol oxidase operon protein cyoD
MADHHPIAAEPQKASKLLKSYIVGFILMLALVLVAYVLVTKHMLDTSSLYIALGVIVLVQVLIQAIFFIRLNAKGEDNMWNLITFIFSIIIMLIVVTGSLWIMYNLNYYMVN